VRSRPYMRTRTLHDDKGYTERNAIGNLIQLVDHLLVSGNGIAVAFIILAISNRRVVNKGISRIAEVGAYFALA